MARKFRKPMVSDNQHFRNQRVQNDVQLDGDGVLADKMKV